MKKKIGLFGGSFDPITRAHMYVAEKLIESGTLDEVHFVPAYVSYHGKEYGASANERIDMIDEACENSEYSRDLRINTFEIRNRLNSCTADFLEKVLIDKDRTDMREVLTYDKEANDYYFIVGGDNAKMIPKFRKTEDGVHILDLIPCVIVNRGAPLDKSITWCREEPHIMFDIGDTHADCSSTKIRDLLFRRYDDGLPLKLFEMCNEEVVGNILSNGLYIGGDR